MNSCTQFREQIEEVALGAIYGEEADGVLAHVNDCPACRSELDSYTSLSEHLTLLSPDAEPPLGFESRTINRLGFEAPVVRFRIPRFVLAAAVIALLVATSIGFVAGNSMGAHSSAAKTAAVHTRIGALVNTSHQSIGTVSITDGAHPVLLMTLTDATPGVRFRCNATLTDGTVVQVATWTASSPQAQWTIPLSATAANAVNVFMVDDEDATLATAVLA